MEIKNLGGQVIFDDPTCKTKGKAVYNAVERGVSLRNADLRRCDLSGLPLHRADLFMADLRGSNLSSCGLRYAEFSRADLQGAKLNKADLYGANVTGACLIKTSLIDARYSPLMMLMAHWSRASKQSVRDMMNFDASSHPNPELFVEWAEAEESWGHCPYYSGRCKIGRPLSFVEDSKCWKPGPLPSIWKLWCRLAFEHGIKTGYDRNGRMIAKGKKRKTGGRS